MAKITLYNDASASATFVPNIFIDQYMTQANGEYVKIYLYLLRCMNQTHSDFSLSRLADHFDCTERDILRALKYWEKLRLFRLDFDESQNLAGIHLLSDSYLPSPGNVRPEAQTESNSNVPQNRSCNSEAVSPIPASNRGSVENDPKTSSVTDQFIRSASPKKQVQYSINDMMEFSKRQGVRELIFITEKYLGRTLNQTDLNMIFYWYDELQLSTELIEYLIEDSVSKGHTSLHYMQKIAEDFAARKIRTIPEAKEALSQDSALYHAVMKAFGIRGRNLVPSETVFLKEWSLQKGFSTELIEEACNRTIRAIHEASFGYANSILEKWHLNGVHTMEDVRKADEAYQQNQKGRSERPNPPSASQSQFTNFKQRENNYNDLQQQLLKKSLQQTPTSNPQT
ncbi:DnaD domain protein [uncultured Eubacterium sp.]|uniref:DnaD domain protein n=1 Tax=uncultured Eubacterium sp. TaxID=165185 RepID=UPI0025DCAE26|nr:DnaD domain protein [uncultured Eubacterium sp.]